VARRIGEDSQVPDAVPIVISDQWSETPAIAQSGEVTLVAWTGYGTRLSTFGNAREVFGKRMNPSGTVIDALPLLISRDPSDHQGPDIAAGDGAFLVSWQTYRWPGHHAPVAAAASVAVVTAGGTVAEPVVLRSLEDNSAATSPRVAWSGSEFFAAWTSREGAFAATLSPLGTVTRVERIPLPSVGEAAFFEGSWHVVSATTTGPYGPIDHIYLTPALTLERILPPVENDVAILQPAIASNGTVAVFAYRRIIRDPPYNGSGRVMFRLYDAPAPAPSRRRAARP
jgi:hypothetical protein